MHARKQLRDEVVSLLTGLTSTGSRVFADRLQSRPLAIDELPALMVSTGAEAIGVGTIHVNGLVNRELDLDVAAVIRAASGLDDALDQISAEVETVLGGQSLAGGGAEIALYAIDAPVFEGSGETPVAQQVMRFRVSYSTAANAPQTII